MLSAAEIKLLLPQNREASENRSRFAAVGEDSLSEPAAAATSLVFSLRFSRYSPSSVLCLCRIPQSRRRKHAGFRALCRRTIGIHDYVAEEAVTCEPVSSVKIP